MEFKDEEKVVNYFRENKNRLPNKSTLLGAKRLAGGALNYTYRLRFEDGNTLILKYFANHMAHFDDAELPQDRYFTEKNALKLIGTQECFKDSRIRTTHLINAFDDLFTLVMEDCGENLINASEIFKKDFVLPGTAHLDEGEREKKRASSLTSLPKKLKSLTSSLNTR